MGTIRKLLKNVARPGRLELPTLCLEGRCSIQLSYGRALSNLSQLNHLRYNLLAYLRGRFRYIRYNWSRNRVRQSETRPDSVRDLLAERDVPFEHGIIVAYRLIRMT